MRRVDLPGILGALLFPILIFRPGGIAGDPGVGWHLEAGRFMLRSGEILRNDPFTPLHREWIHTQWLSDIVIALLHQLGGWPLLELLVFAAGGFLAFVLLPFSVRKHEARVLPEILGALSVLLLLDIQLILRPTVVSFVLFAILFLILNPREKRERAQLFLPLIFVLWANLHSGFLLGLALIALRVGTDLFQRRLNLRLIAIGLLSLAATLLNPYGIKLLLQGVSLGASSYFQNLNQEWLTPDFLAPILPAAVFIFYFLICTKQGTLFERFSLAFLLLLSFKSRRYIPFLAFPFGYFLTLFLSTSAGVKLRRLKILFAESPRALSILPGLVFAVTLIYCLVFQAVPLRAGEDSAPKFSAELQSFLAECEKRGGERVLASPDLGGAIIYLGQGKLQPLIDDRNELHGETAYRNYFKVVLAEQGWEEVLKQLNPHCVVSGEGEALSFYLRQRGWNEFSSGFIAPDRLP